MVLLYMDENVRTQVTLGVRRKGVDVLTVQEDSRRGERDTDIIDRATELGRALYSEDADLLAEAHVRQSSNTPFSGVIYGRQRLAVQVCIEDLELVARAGAPEDCWNKVIYIPI